MPDAQFVRRLDDLRLNAPLAAVEQPGLRNGAELASDNMRSANEVTRIACALLACFGEAT